MKKAAALLAGILSYAILNAAPSILVVDMGQVYQNYYKAKEAAAQINSSIETTKQELGKMDKERQALEKELQAIQEKLNNPALADDAKKKIFETEAQPKIVQIRQIEQNMQNISSQANQRLQQNAQSIRKVHMDEIREIVAKVAAEKKADFILEKGACWYSDPKAEITQDIIKAVNASAPASASSDKK